MVPGFSLEFENNFTAIDGSIAAERIVATTDPAKGVLRELADKNDST